MTEYDDGAQLVDYVFKSYRHQFMTTFESMVLNCFAKPSHQEKTLARNGYSLDDPQVQVTLEAGATAFEESVARRILAEHADEIFVNRCEKCLRIVATPTAKQCLWCGHDWR